MSDLQHKLDAVDPDRLDEQHCKHVTDYGLGWRVLW